MSTPTLLESRVRTESRSEQKRNGGFSLFEIIIGITLFITLSAVVVPSVVTQIRSSNVSALVTKLDGIVGAVSTFYTDVARYPSEYNQLVYDPAGSVATEDNTNPVDPYAFWNSNSGFRTQFPPGRIRRWDGPYLATGFAPIATNAADGLITEFDGRIARDFVMVCASGSRYLAVAVTGITETDARSMSAYKEQDTALGPFELWNDATDVFEAKGPNDAGDAGLVRWYSENGGTLIYLVVAVGAPPC